MYSIFSDHSTLKPSTWKLDCWTFFSVKKWEQDQDITQELSFVDSLFMMYKLRKKITKAKTECRAYDNIRLYSHNFRDFFFYKSMNFRSSFIKNLATERNKELNQKARKIAAEYYLEVLLLQYNTLLFNCEKHFAELTTYYSRSL